MWCRWAIVFPPLEFCVCVRQAILENFRCLCIFLDCWFPQDPYIYISHLPLFHSLFLPFFLCSFPLPLPFLLLDTDSCAISTSFWLTFFSNCQQVQLSTSFEWFLLQGIAIGSNSGSSDQFFLRQSSFIFQFEFTD